MWGKGYLEDLEFGAGVADALEYLLHVLHEAVVEDWLVEFDVTKVTLAFSSFPAGLALLVESGHSKTEIVGA